MEGERAVACVVDNDKPHNPFACGAHLLTYGHRMTGAPVKEIVPHGASYDRALFDKYGYFSETMVVGEDSEFNDRFGHAEMLQLHPGIRTIHRNPGTLMEFLSEQFRRGTRARYLADFFRLDFNASYILSETARRFSRAARLSLRLRGKEKLSAIACWPFLPLGALFYMYGMTTSYTKAKVAERLFRRATQSALMGQAGIAVELLPRAIDLRPASARYYRALAAVLKRLRRYDASVRALFSSCDIDRVRLLDLYESGGYDATAEVEPSQSTTPPIWLQLVVFSDSSVVQLAEFLGVVDAQRLPSNKLSVFVVDERSWYRDTKSMHQVQQSYAHLARFVSPKELSKILTANDGNESVTDRSFVVVTSCSCLPSRDWLRLLTSYINTYPEIDLFRGNIRVSKIRRSHFVERLGYELGLFPSTAEDGGILQFAHYASWACDRSLLIRSGGITDNKNQALGCYSLTERVMRVGGSSLYAADWRMLFRMDSTLSGLLKRSYEDGKCASKHLAARASGDAGFEVPKVRASIAATLRFTRRHFRIWRFGDRSVLLCLPAFFVLLLIALTRQAGLLARSTVDSLRQ
jgi:hypothetical protein